jgi:secreted trypsin-like serine protease
MAFKTVFLFHIFFLFPATAHCILNDVSNPKAITVRSGEWDTKTENELLPSENIKVSKIIIHEDFRKANLHNDISLLVMVSFDIYYGKSNEFSNETLNH